MRCKQGDLAVHIRSGVIVKVLRPHVDLGEQFISEQGRAFRFYNSGAGWVCESVGSPIEYTIPCQPATGHAFKVSAIRDTSLIPIRDADGQDETLTWAGKPEKLDVLLGKAGVADHA